MITVLFYILAAVTVIATVFAITEKHTVHAIVYLVTSFFSLAVIFFLLAAPLVAMFEVIIYAGAIMVLFLFVIMMLDLGYPDRAGRPLAADVWPAAVLGVITVGSALFLAAAQPSAVAAGASFDIRDFAVVLFSKYGIAVEVISMQLMFALVGALYLGRRR